MSFLSYNLINRQKIEQDLNIIIQAIKGNRKSIESLYTTYERYWFRICLRYARNKSEAEDLFQVGVSQVFKKLKTFDSNKSSFKTWSTTLVIRESIKFINKNHWQQSYDDIASVVLIAHEDEKILSNLSTKEIIQLIQKLPSGYRMVFNLFEIEGYTHREISEILNITIGTSKSQLSKAKSILKTQVEILLNS